MYWTRAPQRSDLERGTVFAHGSTRLNLAASDLTAFVDPPDAALVFGFRAMSPDDGFDKSFAVWMATLRRREGNDAVVESLQRIFPALADEKSLEHVLGGIAERARELGYEKVWMVPALAKEPLFAPALKATAEALGRPLVFVPTSGMAALELGPRRVDNAEEARANALARVAVEHQKAQALSGDRYWNHGRGNVQAWVSIAHDVAMQWLRAVSPLPGEPAQVYLDRVAANVRAARGKGPPEDDESWFDGAIDEAARIISGAAR